MTLHTCRDFLSRNTINTGPTLRYYNLYIPACFLRGVLGFTQIGQTNFNLDGPSITMGFGVNNANLNTGSPPFDRALKLPNSYTVSASDVDRIVAIKSNANPMLSSGLFRVTGFDSASNSLFLAARSLLEPPTPETGVTWRVFETEPIVVNTFQDAYNGDSNSDHYRGNGSATCSRIILQSPDPTNWQLRICSEPSDSESNDGDGYTAGCTFAPGFAGNSAGDFPAGGTHLHAGMFFNSRYRSSGLGAGLGGYGNGPTVPRYYMWGDDTSGTCVIVGRQHGGDTPGLVAFGIPEDENQPVPSAIYRLFSHGRTYVGNSEGISMYSGVGNTTGTGGVAFGLGNQPVSCIASSWSYFQGEAEAYPGQSQYAGNIMRDQYAADGVYVAATELESWDLYAGTYDNMNGDSLAPNLSLEPRRLGRFPFARKGRENFNPFSTSVDTARSWLHVGQGIYLPWSGSIVP